MQTLTSEDRSLTRLDRSFVFIPTMSKLIRPLGIHSTSFSGNGADIDKCWCGSSYFLSRGILHDYYVVLQLINHTKLK